MVVEIKIQTIDPLLLQTNLAININPSGSFSYYSVTFDEADQDILYLSPGYINQTMQTNNLAPASPTAIVEASLSVFFTRIGYQTVHSEHFVPALGMIYPLSVCKALSYYPLDSYNSTFYMSLYIELSNVNTTSGTGYALVPYSLKITNLVSGWDNVPTAVATRSKPGAFNTDSGTVQVHLNFSRFGVIKGFSLFVVIMMWIISLAVFTLAFDNYFVQHLMKEVNPAAASLANGLLFALPALRLVQPGIPPLTSYLLVDVCGFYLNMGLVSLSVVLMISKLGWCQYQPKEANVPKP